MTSKHRAQSSPTHDPGRSRGFSMVELMVAIVIGLILVGGAISLLVTSKQTYGVQDDLARLQESGRFALEMMGRDLRMAGYVGCANDISAAPAGPVSNQVAILASGELRDFSRAIEGLEQGMATWAPSNYDEAGAPIAGFDPLSDAITVRHFGGAAAPLLLTMANASADIRIDNSILNARASDIIAVSDCGTTDVVQITNNPNLTGNVDLTHAALSKAYLGTAPDPARVSLATAVRYFIAPSAAAGIDANRASENSLYRQTLVAGAPTVQELLEGVQNMQITYGIDNDDDNVADVYVKADDGAMNWTRVVAIRVGLLLRTTGNRDPDVSTATIQDPVNGGVYFDGDPAGDDHPANDRARYRVVYNTFYLRNNTQ